MSNLSKKRKAAIILSWAFALFCMTVIFVYSNQTASQSSETSDGIIAKLMEYFNLNLSTGFVRSCAHCVEFAGLCFAFNLAYLSTFLRFSPLLSFLSTVFYSSTDEIHQFFIEGRASQVIDLVIDAAGASIITVVLVIVYLIYKKHCEKRGNICQF